MKEQKFSIEELELIKKTLLDHKDKGSCVCYYYVDTKAKTLRKILKKIEKILGVREKIPKDGCQKEGCANKRQPRNIFCKKCCEEAEALASLMPPY